MTIQNPPIIAYKRVPFVDSFVIIGYDWSDATFLLHVRHLPGDTGTPVIALTNAAEGSQGLCASFDDAYVHPVSGATVEATIVAVQIDEATLEALSLNLPPEQPLDLFYDVHATPTGEHKRILFGGPFSLRPGVTI